MPRTTSLFFALFLALASSHALPGPEPRENHLRSRPQYLKACHEIEAGISSASQVFYPPSPQYTADILHFSLASQQNSTCSVEPGTVEDVSKIIKILGSCRTPFAVKGGGHTTNPGFSSTPGVEIALSRFNTTTVNNDSTVSIGPGLTWGEVYETLGPTGVNVVGARTPPVGISGSTLGGGFSYKSSQYGPSIDTMVEYELVLPNGTIKYVTEKDTDLWFGLRGGLNNFGIVTKFTFKSYPQTDIWGGIFFYTSDKLAQVKSAFIDFQNNTDNKAAIILAFAYTSGQLETVVALFYDAPTPPAGIFDKFLAIQAAQGNVSTISYAAFINLANEVASPVQTRNFYEAVPAVKYSSAVFDAFVNHTQFWGPRIAALESTAAVGAALQPLPGSVFSHGSPSAYPPDRSVVAFPSQLNVAWTNASLDKTMLDMMHEGEQTIRGVAIADGQDLTNAALYVNYALFDTPLEDIYGGNVARLHQIKTEIDPQGVMDLTGGFKF